MKALIWSLSIFVLLASFVSAGEIKPIQPTPKDKCPVCGMFVAKYPDFFSEIIYKDGSYAVFDGAKDLFRYYLEIGSYNPSKKESDIDSVYVTDYYTLTPIDGRTAFYVIGSDIYGPMGKELIPFSKETDAREFMKDHYGKSMARFGEVTAATLKEMD
jgi:nitrous oxide reductase accessory protein NosL